MNIFYFRSQDDFEKGKICDFSPFLRVDYLSKWKISNL